MRETNPAKDVALALYSAGCVEISDAPDARPVAYGKNTGVYWNIDRLDSDLYSEQREIILDAFEQKIRTVISDRHPVFRPDRIVGVPDGMNNFASLLSQRLGLGQVWMKKAEIRSGKTNIYGYYDDLESAIVVEDVLNTGKSTADSINVLSHNQLAVFDVVALITRTQSASSKLANPLLAVHPIFTSIELAQVLKNEGLIEPRHLNWVVDDFAG